MFYQRFLFSILSTFIFLTFANVSLHQSEIKHRRRKTVSSRNLNQRSSKAINFTFNQCSFKCPMKECSKTAVAFSQLPHLKKHMLSIHGKVSGRDHTNLMQVCQLTFLPFKDKPYMCSICKDFFKTKLELQQHSESCSVNGELSKDQILSENVSQSWVLFSWKFTDDFLSD